jgi:hypothetical protein
LGWGSPVDSFAWNGTIFAYNLQTAVLQTDVL